MERVLHMADPERIHPEMRASSNCDGDPLRASPRDRPDATELLDLERKADPMPAIETSADSKTETVEGCAAASTGIDGERQGGSSHQRAEGSAFSASVKQAARMVSKLRRAGKDGASPSDAPSENFTGLYCDAIAFIAEDLDSIIASSSCNRGLTAKITTAFGQRPGEDYLAKAPNSHAYANAEKIVEKALDFSGALVEDEPAAATCTPSAKGSGQDRRELAPDMRMLEMEAAIMAEEQLVDLQMEYDELRMMCPSGMGSAMSLACEIGGMGWCELEVLWTYSSRNAQADRGRVLSR